MSPDLANTYPMAGGCCLWKQLHGSCYTPITITHIQDTINKQDTASGTLQPCLYFVGGKGRRDVDTPGNDINFNDICRFKSPADRVRCLLSPVRIINGINSPRRLADSSHLLEDVNMCDLNFAEFSRWIWENLAQIEGWLQSAAETVCWYGGIANLKTG